MKPAKQESWRQKVKTLPDKPGVYLFKDDTGRVIYVGKAACLSKRITSYTRQATDPKTKALVAAIHDLEYILTDTELEALVLENVLIKKEQPRYNIILRDDKNYPYLQLNLNEAFPRLRVVRRIGKKKEGLYYGPYVPTNALNTTLKLLGQIFPLRQCHRLDFKRQRPCLNYQVKRCPAPCKGLVSEKDYMEIVKQTRYFLEGKSQQLKKILTRQMQEASEQLRFEQAARLRDNLSALEQVSQRQKMVSTDRCDEDIIGMAISPNLTCFAVLFIRQGMVIGHKNLLMESEQETNPKELLAAFIQQLYSLGGPQIPKKIILPQFPANQPLLENWLTEHSQQNTQLVIPQRGKKRQLVTLANENAQNALEQRQLLEERSLNLISQVQKDLGLKYPPKRIEGFDISNIQGQLAIGSMVVWQHPGFAKKAYRQFKIKTVSGIDDYAMLSEVIRRRYQRLPNEDKVDLILIDGGKGQVNTAYQVMDELGIAIPMLGLAKREEEIYFPYNSTPLKLPKSSSTLRLLQRIRDEAHRFALKHHRQRRNKTTLKSSLEEIPGIGPGRRKALLAYFGTLEKVKNASLEELTNLPFLPAQAAQNIYAHWH